MGTKDKTVAAYKHGAMTGNHSHPHSPFGSQGGDATHDHGHDHNGDATHDHHAAEMATTSNVSTSGGSVTVHDLVMQAGRAVTAAADGAAWHAYLTVEGLRTTDHRAIAADALTWRDLPLPLCWNADGNDHNDAAIVGKITSITRQDGGKIYAEGTFDLGGDAGTEAARLCGDGMLRWVSIDLEVLNSELITIGGGGMDDPFLDILFGEGGGDADWYEEVTEGRIMGAHMVAFPAFPQAVIAPAGTTLPDVEPMGEVQKVVPGLLACAANGDPPAEWFRNPGLSEPTPVTVTADGHVYGHLAVWGTCHTGIPDACVCPPRSSHGYAYAMTGRVRVADGTFQPVGHLTLGTGHADLRASHRAAAEHYDHTGAAVADVAFGEDDIGIWFAGALRPGVSDDDVRILRASALSGDWRTIGGNLELVAALAVNVPGFPVVAASGAGNGSWTARPNALAASGLHRHDDTVEQVSLVAAGRVHRDPLRPVRAELGALRLDVDVLRRVVDTLLPLARQALTTRVGAP